MGFCIGDKYEGRRVGFVLVDAGLQPAAVAISFYCRAVIYYDSLLLFNSKSRGLKTRVYQV